MKKTAASILLILILLFPISLDIFIWGKGIEKDLYAVFYVLFFISALLLFTKKRIFLFLSLLITFGYTVLITYNIGQWYIFNISK